MLNLTDKIVMRLL